MKVIVSDLGSQYAGMIEAKCDRLIEADGKYAPCQGCFGCWTKHPAACFMKDTLQQVCRMIGQAEELVVITKNLYGGYSADIKNVLDRSIGTSTPFSTYRGRQMRMAGTPSASISSLALNRLSDCPGSAVNRRTKAMPHFNAVFIVSRMRFRFFTP